MALRLQGKLALITAAGQGIGRAIAEAFAAEGARVIATDLEEKKLEGIKSVKRRKLDVRSTAAIEALAKETATEFGALDVLVNCAGYVHHGSVLDCSEQDWDFSFDLHVKSMHRMIKAFLPGMLQKKAGSAGPRRWRRSRFSSPPTNQATSPGNRTWSTAGWRSRCWRPYIRT